MKQWCGFICLWLALVALGSCSTTRHLEKDQYLLRKVSLNLETDRTLAEKGILNDELESLILQKPNTFLFGFMPYKLWLYNLRYEKYRKDTANFQIVSKVVEKPVVLDTGLIARTQSNMQEFLRNQGYFYASVTDTVVYRKKKAYVRYRVHTGTSYLIDSVRYDIRSPELRALQPYFTKHSLLTKNKRYSNVLVGEERSRLTNAIRDQGFYNFGADNIAFELDTLSNAYFRNLQNPFESAIDFITLSGNKKKPGINIEVIIHPTGDSLEFKKFKFNRVVVFPDYSDTADLEDKRYQIDTVNGLEFRFHKKYVNAGILEKKIFIRPGAYYSQEDYNQTLRQLNDLGIFQYVRLFIFADRRDSLNNTLNCYILMNPSKKYDFSTNVEVSGGNVYIIGSAANVSITDRNFLKGANQLTTTVSYGLELGQNKNAAGSYLEQFYLFSQNLGINFKLSFPKFLLPVPQERFSQRSLPHTFLEAGVNALKRINYFSLNSVNAGFGYVWRETETKSWTVRPAFVNGLHLYDIDPAFQARMDSIPAIKNSYEETFIEGESVEFVWNTEGRKAWQHTYAKLGFEEAGLLMNAANGVAEMFGGGGLAHAQYIRLDFDLRQYFLRRNSSFVFRFYGGVGVPYGRSSVMPYLKQYFVGGAYSIRGWRPRVLGPGSYYNEALKDPNNNILLDFVDQSGDIKLEWNGEYRFGMVKLFSGVLNINGALFADAGNIWLMRADPAMEGAEFRWGKLYQDIAVSAGAGLRGDLGGFLVLRVDWAFPLKKPYIMDNHGWVLDEIAFGNRQWRRQNLNLNIAIGYPF